MTESEKVAYYNLHKITIHQTIKTEPQTKPLWRRLFWTTPKDSNKYKSGCVDIFITNFPCLHTELSG